MTVAYEVNVRPDDPWNKPVKFRREGRGRPDANGDHPLRLKAHNEGVEIRNKRFGGRAMVETRRIR